MNIHGGTAAIPKNNARIAEVDLEGPVTRDPYACAFPEPITGQGPRSVAGHRGFDDGFRRQNPIHDPAQGPTD
jgi:hypothetical protein